MSWYKLGLKEKEFYQFYGYIALSDQVFTENPVMFFNFVEILNNIRGYYLPYLISNIIEELSYAFIENSSYNSSDGFDDFFYTALLDGEYYNFEQYFEPISYWTPKSWQDYYSKTDHNEFYLEDIMNGSKEETEAMFIRDMKKNPLYIKEFKLKDKYLMFLKKLNNGQYSQNKLSKNDVNMIMELFVELPWNSEYGGPAWADITDWTFKLQEAGPLLQAQYSSFTLKAAQKLAMIIDVIHSLHHNTSIVLGDLPNNEHQWLSHALDEVAYTEDPVDIAKLSKDQELLKIYQQYRKA